MSKFRIEVDRDNVFGVVTRVYRDGVEIPRVFRVDVQDRRAGPAGNPSPGATQEVSLTFLAEEVEVVEIPAQA